MKTVRIFLVLLALYGAVSCGTMGLSSKVGKTSVGMTKQQVVKELGRNYTVVHAVRTPEGDVEILLFNGGAVSYDYEYEFLNETLVRFTQVLPLQQQKTEHHHHHK